ncbi:hypothetical protein A5651_17520 [Mycobacterium sp. 1274761.0]|nr:hypothetical protein A5651_17520 [Mycobacterium sp. 1274761.0]
MAWADPTEKDQTVSQPSASAGGDADNDAKTGADTTSGATADNTSTSASTTAKSRVNQRPSLTRLASRANDALSSLTRAAEHGVTVATGGAHTSGKPAAQKQPEPDETEPQDREVVESEDIKPAPKKSSATTHNPGEGVIHRLQAVTPHIEARSVDTAAKTGAAITAKNLTTTVTSAAQSAQTFVSSSAASVDQGAIRTFSTTVVDEKSVPTMMAAAVKPVEQPTLPRLLTSLVSAFGLGALAANTPGAPFGSPIVMALLALGTRRESESVTTLTRTAAVGNTPVAALALTGSPTAAVTTPDKSTSYVVTPVAVSSNTWKLTSVTGSGVNSLNDAQNRFGVGGTDLGIMWDNGITDNPNTTVVEQHQVLMLFGDTFSNTTPVRTGVWKNNMLFRSSDTMLSNGIYVRDGSLPIDGTTVDDFSGAPLVIEPTLSNKAIFKQVIANERYAVGNDVTIIPTSAISAPYPNDYGSRQYATFMDVRSWDSSGRWTTNYSGVAFSDDNGVTWHVAPESIRASAPGYSTQPFVNGNQNFQQFALVKPAPNTQDAIDGWVYAYGTPSGRYGTAYLSRVKQDQILDASQYQYWDGKGWVAGNPAAAKPILPATTTSSFFGLVKTTTYPSVGEMSVQYNEYEKQYIMLTTDPAGNVVMRKASRPEGPWSAPITLVSGTKMPGAYAPMIHPWSSTSNVSAADQQYLYWNISTWNDYQVTTMRTDLSKV